MQQKVLILTAIPHSLRLDKEIREIEEAIRRAAKRDQFEIRMRTAIRPQDIRRAIAEERPSIVHFCGHGLKDGSLVLEDDGGKNKSVSPEGLAQLFKLHRDYVNCVLLNACHSAQSATAISQHINYVIGMNQAIQDKAAIAFSQGFYDALGYEYPDNHLDIFQRAFDEALVAIGLENISQGQIPVLILNIEGICHAIETSGTNWNGGDKNCPIVVTSKILDVDYMVTVGRDGRKVLVPASGHTVRLTVEAIDSRTTIIQNLCPILLSRSEAIGSLSLHFGIVTPRLFEVLLDETPPRLKPIDPTRPDFPFKVGPGDPEVFDLKVLTTTGDVKWRLELSWTSLGQEGRLQVDLSGSPFRTMARPKKKSTF